MRREYFLLCYKRYREGSFQLRPVSYTHYVYCRMTVMRSRIDNFFFWTVMFLGLVYLNCLVTDKCKTIDEKLH